MTVIKKNTNNILVRIWRKGNSMYVSGGNVNWYSHYRKQYGGFSQWLHQFTFPPTVYNSVPFSQDPCQHLLFVFFLMIAIVTGVK